MANELSQFKIDKISFKGTGGPVIGKSRYIKPPKCKEIPERRLKYKNAEDLARDIKPELGMRVFVFLDGTFIAGDFLEAWFTEHHIIAKELTISTLSLNPNNVDSLANLMDCEYIENLNLIVSDYFYSHERHSLVPYIRERLDKGDRFQLAAAGTHCKISMFETHKGAKVVIHGSANLRSSSNIEHITIEENPELYDFIMEVHRTILDKYKTINKSVRYNNLWQADHK